jgi:hypothetical protein
MTTLMLIIAVTLTLPMRAQQKAVAPGFSPAKPFTEEQLRNMVRAGLGDDSGAKLVDQRGIDFAPAEDFMQTLKAVGLGCDSSPLWGSKACSRGQCRPDRGIFSCLILSCIHWDTNYPFESGDLGHSVRVVF